MSQPPPAVSALFLAGLLAGCTPEVPVAPAGQAVERPVLLARSPDLLVSSELPADSRGGEPVPERIPVRGPFQLRRTTAGVHSFETDLPVRLRSLFFIRPPEGMALHQAGVEDEVTFRRGSRQSPRDGTWSYSARKLQVHMQVESPPGEGDYELVYGRASERERSLNRQWAEVDGDQDFLLRSAWQGHTSRHGVLLPAPASATWRVRIPDLGHLAMDPGVLAPEVADLPPSDGAILVVQVAAGGEVAQQVASFELRSGEFAPQVVDLTPWAGQQVDLSLRTEPGPDATYDYVFVGEPTLYTPQADPRRVLLVFVDTLRRDRMSLYGYERATTPRLAAWAQGATVFEDARTPAPWTLPAARATLLGAEPEFWGVWPSLPERLGRAGYCSAAFVGNVYLSANFEMAESWSHHFVENWPRADDQVERLEDWLQVHRDRPAVAMLHLMDTHLPYTEPRRYRKLWAQQVPAGLAGSFLRGDVLSSSKGKGKKQARQYVQDRYDSSIRYLDDQVADVLDQLGPQDVAVFFSDHGEEFWEHGGFEHGHTLYEELLAVPLAIAAPGLSPGRVQQPVSLQDLTPTLLELLGVPGDSTITGRSLVPLAAGDAAAAQAFAERLHGFGRPLYGDEQWGVLDEQLKYATKAGREEVYDLQADPGELSDLARERRQGDLPALRQAVGVALGRPSHLAFRLRPDRVSGQHDLQVVLHVPGGVKTAWVGEDATLKSKASVSWEGETARAVWEHGHSGTREVFVVPTLDAQEAAAGLVMELRRGDDLTELSMDPDEPVPGADGRTRRLLRGSVGGLRMTLTYGVAPEPPAQGRSLQGYDPETAAALKALGYLDDDDEVVVPEDLPPPTDGGDEPAGDGLTPVRHGSRTSAPRNR